MEVFRKAQGKFLYLNPKRKMIKTTRYKELREHCKMTNNPGGCYELFQELKAMTRDMGAVPSDCAPKLSQEAQVRDALWQSVELMVRLGWGEQPPTTYFQKFGWLDRADMSLFCALKGQAIDLYGESSWTNFRERMFKELPGASQISRSQAWDMSILSENCARYP